MSEGAIDYTRGCNIHNSGTFSTFKTGKLRIFKPLLDESSCNKCKLCHYFCPEGCIDWSKERVIIDYEYCKGCGICSHECPSQAIQLVREEE